MANVTIYPTANFTLPPGFPIQVLGVSATELATDYVSSSLFASLFGLPVTGQITWGCNLESHPTGALNLQVLRSAIALIRAKFVQGAEITFANIGFSVNGYSETLLSTLDYPSGLYEVQVSLTGKWDAPKYQKASLLKGGAGTSTSAPQPVFQDPDCVGNTNVTPVPTTPTTTTVFALSSQVGVSFSASGSNWAVEIPKNAPAIASAQWLSEAQSRLRHNDCYLDLCSASGVQAKQLNTGALWVYNVPSLEVQSGQQSEYPNVQISGTFLTSGEVYEPEEDTQADAAITLVPSWVAKPATTVVLTSGSTDPAIPYSNTSRLKNLSLNWDVSGDTKTLRVVTTIDGMPSLDQEWIYGFTYTAAEVIDTTTKKLNGNPVDYWGIVQYKQIDYLYDPGTGYALGSNTTGYKLGRHEREPEGLSANRATLEATGATLDLYKFQSIQVFGKTRYVLKQFADYYKEAAEEKPPLIFYKTCLPSGGSTWNYVIDSTYVPPLFVAEELTYTTSFLQTPNPEASPNTPEDNNLITGEESLTYLRRVIAPSSNTKPIVGTILGGGKVGDRYTEFHGEASAQNAQFDDQSMRETFSEHEGQPPPATRKPPTQEQVPPPTGAPDMPVNPTLFEYRLTTLGYTANSPDGGSFSDPFAKTANEALKTAKATIQVEDLQSQQFSAKIPFNAQIRPMDRMQLRTGYDTYNVRVLSFSNSVLIQGQLNGLPLITSPEGTQIECGIDRLVSVTMTKKAIPAALTPPDQALTVYSPVFTVGLTLGDLISPDMITRRNY